MGLSNRAKNVLTAVVALVLVAGFIYLAEGRKNNDESDRLAALEATTTTVRRTTTTSEETTTTLFDATTSSAAPATTVTTKKPSSGSSGRTTTTRRSTATTASPSPGPTGPSHETSDNSSTFVHNSDGSVSTSASASDASRPFAFSVKTCFPQFATSSDPCPSSGGGATSEGMEIKFVVTLKNNTNRTISFGDDGLLIDVRLNRPDGTVEPITMNASTEKTLEPGRGLVVSATKQEIGFGSFSWTAACDIDYGS